jgi:hypothetical protein
MNWRRWLYLKLTTSPEFIALVPAVDIVGGGSLTGSPRRRPFVVIRVNDEFPELRDDGKAVATSRSAAIWAYDEPGSYDRIDSILEVAKDVLQGQVLSIGADEFPSGIAALWTNDSIELADDELAAITRSSTYRLVGSRT